MQNWSEFRTVKDIHAEDGKILMAEVEIFLARDASYGSDADGNRGIERTVIEDYRIDGIWNIETGEDVTDAYKMDPIVTTTIEKSF